jgi:hypothetical protein
MSNKKKKPPTPLYPTFHTNPSIESWLNNVKQEMNNPKSYLVEVDSKFGKKGLSYDKKSYGKPDDYYVPIFSEEGLEKNVYETKISQNNLKYLEIINNSNSKISDLSSDSKDNSSKISADVINEI